MWSPLLLELLCYLNSHDTPLQKQGKEMHEQKSDAANGATHGFRKTASYLISNFS